MNLEQDLCSGHAVTSARDLREILRKIFVGEREHSRFLTAFAEAISFADSENFYALAPSALLLIDRYPPRLYLRGSGPRRRRPRNATRGRRLQRPPHRTPSSHPRRQSLGLVQVR